MTTKSSTYYLDLKDKQTRSRIESAKPGGKTVQVRVRCEETPADKPLVANGILSGDSTKFHWWVETSDGPWSHDEDWKELIFRVHSSSD